MRQDCKYFESRSFPNGDTIRRCRLGLAPEAPWRCPENCERYEKRRVDVNWSHEKLVTPPTPMEPDSLGDDDSIRGLMEDVAGIMDEAAPEIIAEVAGKKGRKGRLGRMRKKSDKRKKRKRDK